MVRVIHIVVSQDAACLLAVIHIGDSIRTALLGQRSQIGLNCIPRIRGVDQQLNFRMASSKRTDQISRRFPPITPL